MEDTVMTAPATGPATESGMTEPPAPTVPAPEVKPATGGADGELGEGGLKALEAERKARAAAEKTQKALEAKVKAFEDAQKTDADRAAERIAELEQKAAQATRYEAAEKAGLPLSLAARLNGSTLDEMVADAEQLKQLLAGATPAPDVPSTPKPDRRQGGGTDNAVGTMTAGRDLYKQRNRT